MTRSADTAPAKRPASASATVAQTRDAPESADDTLPLDREQLFGSSPAAQLEEQARNPEASETREELFGLDQPVKPQRTGLGLKGFVQFEPAYTYSSPGHWSRGVVRTQLETQGQMNERAKWKASLRLDVDPVYFESNFYPEPVKDDQQLELLVRETYLDLGLTDNWELRLGRQHIIWGEVVGLFFADVVSAKDFRDFILPPFDVLRIPQWAARAEFFAKEAHFELLWIPYPSYDNIGEPGSEFYLFRPPATPGFDQVLLDDERPSDTLDNTNYGLRASGLFSGWDLSAFYYRSTSAAPTFYREMQLAPTPTVFFRPRHDRIWQAGGTLGKDLRSFVMKGSWSIRQGAASKSRARPRRTGSCSRTPWTTSSGWISRCRTMDGSTCSSFRESSSTITRTSSSMKWKAG